MISSFDGIKGLGPARVEALRSAGISTPEQLLMTFPVKYADYSTTKTISECVPGEEAVIRASVSGTPSQARVNGKTITRAVFCDETGKIQATWFNQPWMFKTLAEGGEFTVSGRVETMKSSLKLTCPRLVTELRITPEYKPIEKIGQKQLRGLIEFFLESAGDIEETLPEGILSEYELMSRTEALRQVHFPTDRPSLERALKRFSFEEMLSFMLCSLSMKRSDPHGVAMESTGEDAENYWNSLGFAPTNAQKNVLEQIRLDLASPKAMARLVQGDVGCGKTAVAFGAIFLAARAGYQSAMMAPTEILAGQHYESAKKILEPLGIRCGLLTGSMSPKQHKIAAEAIESGAWQAVFGTHALITESVRYQNLGLAVTDEQHRFGVRQRTLLGEKGLHTNVLVMSATPIPRTLALILYGDLDISVIDELPPGRQPVKTRIVGEEKREAMYGFIDKEINAGRQVYFVCPLVEDSEAVEAESAERLFDSLRDSALGKHRIALVHGKMKADEKENVLELFRTGEIDVLVSTTVIEVGINVPNATVMVVENAERFGLAQLHQLRGRVGRGTQEAWCFLMAPSTQKLQVLTRSNDGFYISRKDMELRGPGDMFGTRQSGAVAGLDVRAAEDSRLLAETHALARRIVDEDSRDARKLRENAQNWLNKRTNAVFAAN